MITLDQIDERLRRIETCLQRLSATTQPSLLPESDFIRNCRNSEIAREDAQKRRLARAERKAA